MPRAQRQRKRVMRGERTAIEREMFIAAVPETVFGFLIDPALTGQWVAAGIAFLMSSHKKGCKSHDSQGGLERGVVGGSQTVACQGEGVLATAGRTEPGAQRSTLGTG